MASHLSDTVLTYNVSIARGMMPGGPGVGQYIPPGRPAGHDGMGMVNADRQLQASTQESCKHVPAVMLSPYSLDPVGGGREGNIDPDLRTAQSGIAPSEATVAPTSDDVVTMTRADIKALVIEETQKSVMETLAGLQENRPVVAEPVPVEVRVSAGSQLSCWYALTDHDHRPPSTRISAS